MAPYYISDYASLQQQLDTLTMPGTCVEELHLFPNGRWDDSEQASLVRYIENSPTLKTLSLVSRGRVSPADGNFIRNTSWLLPAMPMYP